MTVRVSKVSRNSNRLTYSIRLQSPNVCKSLCVSFRVLNQDVDYQFVLFVLSCKKSGLVIVAALTAHRDGCVKIKLEVTRRFDEFLKFLYVLQFRVAV